MINVRPSAVDEADPPRYRTHEQVVEASSPAWWQRGAAWVPMVLVLAVQAYLSGRLFHLGTASGDEARYIYAGHQLIHEFWHGGGSPYYETYFSGAPVIFPVLAAMADHFGGYIAVRLMSLVFMLTATTMLFLTTRKFWGYWGGLIAASLFAGLGLTQDLGALATHDAMSLMLMTVAAYFAVRTGPRERYANWWLLAVPATLFLANATKYATLLFDPIVIGLAAAQVRSEGYRRVFQRIMTLGAATSLIDVAAVALAGSAYYHGIMFSTLNRSRGSDPIFATMIGNSSVASARTIVTYTWAWTGAILVAAVLALVLAVMSRRDRDHAMLLGLLVVAGIVVTLEGIHLHSVESMRKHDDYGIWFTCIAAGYLPGRFAPRIASLFGGRVLRRGVSALLMVVSLGASAVLGAHYSAGAAVTYEAKNQAANRVFYDYLKPFLRLPHAKFLIGGLDNEQIIYTDHVNVPWYRLFDDVYLKYPIPGRGGDSHGERIGKVCGAVRPGCMYLEGPQAYLAAIHAHWFALISMVGGHHDKQDAVIEQAVRSTPGYVLLTTYDRAPTWIYSPDYVRARHHTRA